VAGKVLAAFDGSGMRAVRFAAMASFSSLTFLSWVQERNQMQEMESVLKTAAAKPEVQWIEAEIACRAWYFSPAVCASEGTGSAL
jgi:hypothetical protein